MTAPLEPAGNRIQIVSLGLVAALIGAWAWRAPWDRWFREASLWLLLPAFMLIGLGQILGGVDPYTYGVYFVVIFAWIGVCHRPWTSVRIAPIATVAYLLPLAVHAHGPTALASVPQVLPLCIVVGEALSRLPNKLRHAEDVDLRRMSDMKSLVAATEVLAHQTVPAAAADLVSRLAIDLFGATAALVLLRGNESSYVTTGSRRWEEPPRRVVRGQEPKMERAIEEGMVVAAPWRDSSGPLSASGGFRTVLFLPLRGSAAPIGAVALGFDRDVETLDPFASYMALTFTTQAGLAFERLEVTKLLLDATLRDELTRLGNRRRVESGLRELARGDAVILFDLDHFKKLNDTQGHAAGDAALRAFAAHLKQALRGEDWAARYGGDEFLAVLRGAAGDAHRILERLVESWHQTSPPTTFTAGVALHWDDESPAETLARADRALYAAKEGGRDRVSFAEEAPKQAGKAATEGAATPA
ncbi:MAG: GGDEF domain-containing protein [Actinomycetota bacterium]|nr:GGDEF domain-containing protein [Actinomycetota bacterium]